MIFFFFFFGWAPFTAIAQCLWATDHGLGRPDRVFQLRVGGFMCASVCGRVWGAGACILLWFRDHFCSGSAALASSFNKRQGFLCGG